MPDMQFQVLVMVRRIGDGKRTPTTVLEDKFNVLSGEELQAFGFRQFETHQHNVV